MRIRTKTEEGESRELLLKEYFLNAYLIALLKQVGTGARRKTDRENAKVAQGVPEQN